MPMLFFSYRKLTLFSLLFTLSSCSSSKQQESPPLPELSALPNEESLNQELTKDSISLILLETMAPVSEAERAALELAREKMALVKSTFSQAEKDKKIALDAKSVYGDRVKDYQQSLAQSELARQARSKAMGALAAAQKEIDDSWSAVASARESLNKTIIDPKSTPEQRATAEANLARAYERTSQAEIKLATRTSELDLSQKNYQMALSAVTRSAENSSQAGREYAERVSLANRSIDQYNSAVSEEKKSLAVISAMNQDRAGKVAQSLASAALQLATSKATLESAKSTANSSAIAQKNSSEKLTQATKDTANAKLSLSDATKTAQEKLAIAREKAAAKGIAEASASEAQKAYSAAKASYDSASQNSSLAASEARAAAKSLADATAKNLAAAKNLEAAIAANNAKDTPETRQALAKAQASADEAARVLEAAKERNTAAQEKAASAAAALAQVKAVSDARYEVYKNAASLAAKAARESSTAESESLLAAKSAEKAAANLQYRIEEQSKASQNLEKATRANQVAQEKLSTANRAELEARNHYHAEYQKNEVYRLSPTQSEQEMYAEDQKLFPAALWSGVSEGNYWTSIVIAAVRQNLANLEKARDLNEWCPGYFDANTSIHQKEVCWLRMIGGLVKFESNFKPDDSFRESNGNWSVGLMALSPKECRSYETVDLLKQPLLNLSCGIGKFADLVVREGYISGPPQALGAARYWSTLRPPYTQQKPDGSGVYQLGKKKEILPFTRAYRNF